MTVVVEAQGLSYRIGTHSVLEEISFSLRRGERMLIVGPNGGGKSTLLKLMAGQLSTQTGRIEALGDNPARVRNQIGWVSQFAPQHSWFPLSVRQLVLTGCLQGAMPRLRYTRTERHTADRALNDMGLLALKERAVSKLSGGEMQRALIARALATEPRLLLLDEPTANLDPTSEQRLFERLGRLSERLTVVMVSHNLQLAKTWANRCLYVNRTGRELSPGAEHEAALHLMFPEPPLTETGATRAHV
ncbi:MAG: ATP-binding cassette domain-containing protein [Pseudomonadota bacterium]|nr:ATP-binding cassette domain-containing protein [Pseudomonadota bacterium]